jgi:hypothetical protein
MIIISSATKVGSVKVAVGGFAATAVTPALAAAKVIGAEAGI